jgi:hypothetical protein
MKKHYMTAIVAAIAMIGGGRAMAIQLDYANTPGADISFNGSSQFDFTAGAGGSDFFIDSPGPEFDDLGTISGTYTIGTVTASGSVESASVTGSGTLTIADGLGHNLTAGISWIDASQDGTGTTLNLEGNVNLTGVSYTGTDPALLALAAGTQDSATLDFTFNPAISLAQLKAEAAVTTYSGTIDSATRVPDHGSSAMMLGAALCAMGMARVRYGGRPIV